jgi:DNA-binding transcriptional ArsR family regulator
VEQPPKRDDARVIVRLTRRTAAAWLAEAGLVSERRDGTRRLYQARSQGLEELMAFLEGFWDERLDALRREAERKEARKRECSD